MKYILELVPWSRRDVDLIMEVSGNTFDYYTIPEGPGGYPGLFSLATAMYVKYNYGRAVLPHIRLLDINRLALLSIANAVEEYGLDGLVLLRGDRPVEGLAVDDVGSEEGLRIIKNKNYSFKTGLIISLNYPLEKIVERIRLGADFYHVINYDPSRIEKLGKIKESAHRQGSEIYVFILLGIGRNIKLFKKLKQPFIQADNLGDQLEELKKISDGVVLSTPLEPVLGIKTLQRVMV